MTSASPHSSLEPGCSTGASTQSSNDSGSTLELCSGAKQTRVPKRSSKPGCATASSMPHPSGPMSEPWKVLTSTAELTLWLGAFPARTCPSQATGLALAKALAAASSSICSASQPIAERLSSSWRTSGALFPLPPMFRRPRTKKGSEKNGPSPWSSEPWPMPGMTLRGSLYAHPMPGLPTVDSECSSLDGDESDQWRTPCMTDWHPSKPDPNRTDAQIALPHQVEQWQTPSSGNFRTRGGERTDELGLDRQVKQWPTPNSADSKRETAHKGGNPSLPMATKAWPTPRCEDGECAGGHRGKDDTLYGAIVRPKDPRSLATPSGNDANNGTIASGEFKSLNRDVHGWATPAARDYRYPNDPNDPNGASRIKRSAQAPTSGDQLPNQIGGSLNPDWVEILMGWPIGWTDAVNPCPGIWPGWPMGMGPDQHPYEPPRTAPKNHLKGRVARIKACGNGVVPQQADAAFFLLLQPAIAHLAH